MRKLLIGYYNFLINRCFSKPKFYKVLVGSLKDTYLFTPLRAGVKKYIGVYEKKQTYFINGIVKKGQYCVDAGSHIGYMSLLMSKLVGELGHKMCDLEDNVFLENTKFKGITVSMLKRDNCYTLF